MDARRLTGIFRDISAIDPSTSRHQEELPALAALLADQLAILDDVRPVGPTASGDGEVVTFMFWWPVLPADQAMLDNGRVAPLRRVRTEFLDLVAPSLSKLVELDLDFEVMVVSPSVSADPRRAAIHFFLGAAKERTEEREGLLNWAAQVRRNAREQRGRYRRRRAELQHERRRIAIVRGDAADD